MPDAPGTEYAVNVWNITGEWANCRRVILTRPQSAHMTARLRITCAAADNRREKMSAFMLAVIAALIWGVVPLLEKTGLNATVDALAGLFYRCVGVILGLLVLVTFIIKPSHIKTVSVKPALLLISAGFLASFVAQIAFYKALKLGQVSRVVPISGSYPFIAFILGVLFLGESFNLAKLFGCALIIVGIWLLKFA